MAKFVCTVCGYIYDEELGDPDNGIEPGTLFADLPDDWECPLCSVGKEDFEEEALALPAVLTHITLKEPVHRPARALLI